MDISLFAEIMNDKNFKNFNKLKYKYADIFPEFLENLKELYCKEVELYDFSGRKIVYLPDCAPVSQKAAKLLFSSKGSLYGMKAAEEEIAASSAIENIDFSRDSIRNILKGLAPEDEEENRILGQKNGLQFISDTGNKITEENIFRLYMMTVGDFLDEENSLKKGNYYRHDSVFVMSNRLEHSGADFRKLPEYMKSFVEFINADDDINDLQKAAIIHFYFAYIHPYFDGNGRMARLMHLWFLIQRGYEATLFVSFSSMIKKSKKEYYQAFTLVEENSRISSWTDVTPFISYFSEYVYSRIVKEEEIYDGLTVYKAALKDGIITEKEKHLWSFVLSRYGKNEFSTKMLERDYGDAAYATVRSFVLKFEKLGLLASKKYKNRTKYSIIG